MRLAGAITLVLLSGLVGCRDHKPTKNAAPVPAATSPAASATPAAPVFQGSVAAAERAEWVRRRVLSLRNYNWRGHLAACWRELAATAEQVSRRPAVCISRGDAALARGDAALACRYFQRATELDGGNLDAARGLAIACVASDRPQETIPVYLRLLKADDTDHVSRFNLAVAYGRLEEWSLAEQAYRRLLADNDHDVRAAYNLATLLQAQGKLADAKDQWKQVTQVDPSMPGPFASLGELYMDLQEPELAFQAFAKAANLEPNVARHWMNMGTAARSAGEMGKALASYRRAMKISGPNADVWREIGSTQLEIYRATGSQKFLAEAVASWRKCLAIDAHQPDVANWIDIYSAALSQTQPISEGKGQD